MLDIIALVVIALSLLMFVYSLTQMKKEPRLYGAGSTQTATPSKEKSGEMPTEIEAAYPADEEPEEAPIPGTEDEFSRGSMPTSAGVAKREPEVLGDRRHAVRDRIPIERKASLIYWERMCLEEEFDLTVTLHKPEFKVAAPEGSSVHESETVYKLPRSGHVRVIPVCSGCNISPAYRDVKVEELDTETRAEFKVLPVKEGDYDLQVEFHTVSPDGKLSLIGIEKTEVHIQKKPIDLTIGALNISVSRRVPAFFSMVGSFFGLISFILARFGVNVNEELVAYSATISTSFAGVIIILIAMMLLFKGLRPLMREISITLK